MSVLVFAEQSEKKLEKAAFELVTYGHKLAGKMGGKCMALIIGEVENGGDLAQYGADEIHHIEGVDHFNDQVYTAAIAEAVDKLGATVVVIPHSANGRALLGRLAVRLDAGSAPAVIALPEVNDHLSVQRNVFSGKATATYELLTGKKVISLVRNSIAIEENPTDADVQTLQVDLPDSRVRVEKVDKLTGETPLAEAELVVSAGRGMKGPENWDIIEELAGVLGAATACSRPVADTGWRPHHEHVGQTGQAIRPNLYIAIGISGAIQHLAGVNQSKVIVVINKDPEAPFFKAADYGVCADLFDVVPALTESLKKYKAEN